MMRQTEKMLNSGSKHETIAKNKEANIKVKSGREKEYGKLR
jgi:hypothetical protein